MEVHHRRHNVSSQKNNEMEQGTYDSQTAEMHMLMLFDVSFLRTLVM